MVHPLTGKEILKIFRVYMSDGTFTAVEMNALSTASEMSEHVIRCAFFLINFQKRKKTHLFSPFPEQ